MFEHEGESSKPCSKTFLKLDSNTPKFHGNANEDVDDWLFKVKINLDIAQIPGGSKCLSIWDKTVFEYLPLVRLA
jgi:hypothetical protein